MNDKLSFGKVFVLGFALFAMFFGAGNLIFPPALGIVTGTNWMISFLVYILADAGLAILALLAFFRCQEGFQNSISIQLDKTTSFLLILFNTLCIGPFIAIPRTAATTFDIAIKPLLGSSVPGWASWVAGGIYFGLVLILCLKPGKVVDIIGKILSPTMFVALLVLIGIGIVRPLGKVAPGSSTMAAVKLGLESGFEWACGLPGTVGGAVYGNAGAFGSSVADSFRSCVVIGPDGEEKTLGAADMDFTYRSSILKKRDHDLTVLQAFFCVAQDEPEQIRQRGEINREKRRAGQPVSERSLGSVFKNPEGMAAGKLIQDAGLKGTSIGNARVSEKHANFITTAPGVRSEDYRKLISYVQKTVSERFGVWLEPEIEFLGFED